VAKINGGFNSGKIKFWRPVSGQKRRDWRKLSPEERKKLESPPFKERVKAFFKRVDRTKFVAVSASVLALIIVAGVVLSLALGGGDNGGNNSGNDVNNNGDSGSTTAEYDRLFEFSSKDGGYELTAVKSSETEYIIPEEYDRKTVKSIAEDAFKNAEFIEILSVPNGVKTLGYKILADLKNLKELTLPFVGTSAEVADLNAIENSEARFCHIFGESNSAIPQTLKTLTVNGNIPKNAFKDATGSAENKIETIKIGDGVETLNERALSGCPSLEKITVGENVKDIKPYAFADCPLLLKITVDSKKLTSVAPSAFGEDLSSLTFSAYSEDDAKDLYWYMTLIKDRPNLEHIIKFTA
jgi:hypothetical protein